MECIAYNDGKCMADGEDCFAESVIEECYAAYLMFGRHWEARDDLYKKMMGLKKWRFNNEHHGRVSDRNVDLVCCLVGVERSG